IARPTKRHLPLQFAALWRVAVLRRTHAFQLGAPCSIKFVYRRCRCERSFLMPKRPPLQSRRLLAQCAIPSNKALETASLSGGSECGTTSVGANPLHHGTEAIRALRREMFAQTHAFEQFDGIGVQNLPCALARIDSEQDRNQSAHDMGIAVTAKGQHGRPRAVRAHRGVEPDLARAALDLVGITMRR